MLVREKVKLLNRLHIYISVLIWVYLSTVSFLQEYLVFYHVVVAPLTDGKVDPLPS